MSTPLTESPDSQGLSVRSLAVAYDLPMEYSAPGPAPRWLVIGTGVFGAAVIVDLIVGLVVTL